jgi:N-formylglutamate amidohydrolase
MSQSVLPTWTNRRAGGPVIATAIHDGHLLRHELVGQVLLSELDRFREEDPFTSHWATIGDSWLVVHRSRFECDLNRPRESAVYRQPSDCWGLEVWRRPLSDTQLSESLAYYDAFYAELRQIIEETAARERQLVVYDIHSYNHRREGPGTAADPAGHPEVNIGTGTMDRRRWAHVVDRFITDLRTFDYLGRRLDVRENVKFFGGHMPNWIHQTYPQQACVLAIEIKKFYIDEWSGEADPVHVEEIRRALASTIPGVVEELRRR